MITVFLPCRKGSQRVKNKNIRQFAGIEGGLARIKLEQLSEISNIDEIILSTNDKAIIDIGQKMKIPRLRIDRRPEHLCTDETTTDELIKYVPSLTENEHILWTHVTSPFINAKSYEVAIQTYLDNSSTDFDSLMSVTKLQTFIWDKQGPINYDRNKQKWPFTQSLLPLYEVNSGMFISTRNNYISLNDRIGKKPYLYILNKRESFDIDWEDDFYIAEKMYP